MRARTTKPDANTAQGVERDGRGAPTHAAKKENGKRSEAKDAEAMERAKKNGQKEFATIENRTRDDRLASGHYAT